MGLLAGTVQTKRKKGVNEGFGDVEDVKFAAADVRDSGEVEEKKS